MTMLRTNRYRRAFTLTELMVSMALSIGIMWILAESFKMGLDFTRDMRSTGSMMTQLDGARAVLARDLAAEHFTPDDNNPSHRGVRLSDQRLDLLNATTGTGWNPPKGGFFRIISPYVDPTNTATTQYDTDNFAMNTVTNNALHFTSILPEKEKQLYSANSLPGGTTPYASRAAEIAYFLVDSGIRTSPGPTGQTLYYLVRRQRLVAVSTDNVLSLSAAAADTAVIASDGASVYTLAKMIDPVNYRLQVLPTAVPSAVGAPLFGGTSPRYEDIVLSNVLSFEVQVDWSPNANGVNGPFGSRLGPRPFTGDPGASPVAADRYASYPGTANSDYPFDNLGVIKSQNTLGSGVFDTWYPAPTWNVGLNVPNSANATKLPLAVRVKQIQITARIFDGKTKKARQSTWKFSL